MSGRLTPCVPLMVIAKHGTYSTYSIINCLGTHVPSQTLDLTMPETIRNMQKLMWINCGAYRQVSRGRCRQLQVQLVWLLSLAGLETKKGPMVF